MQAAVVRICYDGDLFCGGSTFVDVPLLPDTTAADVLRCCTMPGDDESSCRLAFCHPDDTVIEPGSKLLGILQKQLQHQNVFGTSGKASAVRPGGNDLSSGLKLRLTRFGKPGGLASTREGKDNRSESRNVLCSMLPMADATKPKRDLSKGWSFAEIQQLAVQQRQQMEANQRMLTDRERQLRDFETSDAERVHQSAADSERLRQLQAYAAKQEVLLQRVRAAVSADTDAAAKQKQTNNELSTELEAARAEFQRKQSLLAAAVCKVADLTKQLEQLRTEVKVNATDRGSSVLPSSYKSNRIEALQKEYEAVKELRAKRARVRAQLQENLGNRHRDAAALDGRLVELQLDAKLRHQAALDRQQQVTLQRPSSSPAGPSASNGVAAATPAASRPASNIAAVEPFIHNPSPVALGVKSYDLPGASPSKQQLESPLADRSSLWESAKVGSHDSTTLAASRPGFGMQPTFVSNKKTAVSGGDQGSPGDLPAIGERAAAPPAAGATVGSPLTSAADRQLLLGSEGYVADGSRQRQEQPLEWQQQQQRAAASTAVDEGCSVRQQLSSSEVAVSKVSDFVSPNLMKGDGSSDVVRTSVVVGLNDLSSGSSSTVPAQPAGCSSAGGSAFSGGPTSSLSSEQAGPPMRTVATSLATTESFGWRPRSPPEAAGGASRKLHTASAAAGAQASSVDVKLPSSSTGIVAAMPSSAVARPVTALHSMLPRPWPGGSAASMAISIPTPGLHGSSLPLPAATRLAGPNSAPVVTAATAPKVIATTASVRSFGEQRPTSSATMVVRATQIGNASKYGEAAFPLGAEAEQPRQTTAPAPVPSCSSGKTLPQGQAVQPTTSASFSNIVPHAVVQRNTTSADSNIVRSSAPHGYADSGASEVAAAVTVSSKSETTDRRAAGPLEPTISTGSSATGLMPSQHQPAGVATMPKLAGDATSLSVVRQLSRDASPKGSAVVIADRAVAGGAMSSSSEPPLLMTDKATSHTGGGAAVAADCTMAGTAGGTGSKANGATAAEAEPSHVTTADCRAAESFGSAASMDSATIPLPPPSLWQSAFVASVPKQAGSADPTASSWLVVRQCYGEDTPKSTASTALPGGVTVLDTSAVAICDAVTNRASSKTSATAAVGTTSARDQQRMAEVDGAEAERDATDSSDELGVRQCTSSSSTAAGCSPGVAGMVPSSSSATSLHDGAAMPSLSFSNEFQRRVTFHPKILLLDAALQGELHIVQAATNKVSVNTPNEDGVTALHNAIIMGNMAIVEYLVKRGCDVNAQDIDGWMPLHCAASCNNLTMAKYLVEHGACVFAATLSDQQTAAQKCEKNEEGYEGCREYLERVEAELGVANDGIVYALYDYERESDDELSLRTGQRLTVLRCGDDQETEWWWARHDDKDGGDEGYVPRNLLGVCQRLPPHILSDSDIGESDT